MFFGTWYGIYRIIIVGILAYLSLVLLLRVSGKRTLSKMNAFDLIVTVGIGSVLGIILLNKKVPLMEGITAYLVLIGMQYVVAWFSVRSHTIDQLVKSSPSLLYYRDQFIKGKMKKERIAEMDVFQAVRDNGYASLKDVNMVILEADGGFSVIGKSKDVDDEVMKHVREYRE
ncbi:DUF421 domain-containing protein [Rossellomorea aquimaris]|uniref:DUF421 domain-containing protein n=1 Tax=Rossellomorea aquimaris TaxID=189382 RepID=UPI001CD19B25|nr:YetF domain-containing protein [Rossellomorea aquimaris]MCA1059862.1 DUF421 domain-containing protein [Rossellomorea aquimaris]